MKLRRGDNPYIRAISFLLSLIALAIIFVVIAGVRSPGWTAALLTDNVGLDLKGFWSGVWACTHSQGYWKTHPEEWPMDELLLGAETYTQSEAILLLEAPPKGDASLILAHQLIAARLNVASGTDGSPIADALAAADAWLGGYEGRLPYGIECSSPAGQIALALAITLYEYNSGLLGPGGCDEEDIEPCAPLCTSEVIETLPLTATATLTVTPAVTLTITPEVSPEPTATPLVMPSLTPTATWTPTGEPSPGSTPTITITLTPTAEPTHEMTTTPVATEEPVDQSGPEQAATSTPLVSYTPTVTLTDTPTPTPEPTSTPVPAPTYTPVPTITPEPATVGTSLAVTITAEGFWTEDPEAGPAAVRGEICVLNNGEAPTENLAILGVIQVKMGADPFVDYLVTALDLSENAVLASGEIYCFRYEIAFLPLEGAAYRTVARVTITNHSGWLPGSAHCPGPELCAYGPEPKAEFALP